MKLSPREVEKLMLHNAGFLAQKRIARGSRLNYTEAVALIATQEQALPIVPHLLDSVQVEGTFPNVPSLEKVLIIEGDTIPGELILRNGNILLNSGREAVILKVTNDGDRPI
ncbi:amidohydrolase 1 [Tanacetum coccineum]